MALGEQGAHGEQEVVQGEAIWMVWQQQPCSCTGTTPLPSC